MFKLIKNIADFKNIIYLIAFDYEIVSKLLKDIGDKNYLEKIINVPLYLPKITQNELYNILLENLKDISRKYNLEKDDERLNKLLNKIIYFFNHMRDIKRFFNIFDFNFELVKDEVDFIDFIALTVIQVFEPESYNKLFSYGPFISGSSMTKVNEKNDITNGNKHVRYVLDFLTNNSSSNLALYSEKQNNWDCYFKLNPNIKEVKEEELNLFFEYVNSKNKKEAANKKLKDMLDYNEKYLDAIKYRLERIKELELFLECLFQYGNYPLFFAFLSSNKDLIRKIKEKNKEYDFAIFFNKINNVYEFDNFLKYFQKLVEDSLLFECEYDELETIAKNKYINHFNNFNSDYYRYLSNFLYIGYKLSFDDKLKKFVNDELLSTKEGLINLLDHIVYVQSNSDSEKWRIQQISNAVSIDIICEKIKQHDITNEESVKRFREDYSRYESLWNNSYDPNFTEPPVTWSEIKFERV